MLISRLGYGGSRRKATGVLIQGGERDKPMGPQPRKHTVEFEEG
jgi:hypothetical protein